MKRFSAWIASLLVLALLAGCASAGSYIQGHYPLVDVQGKGKDVAKVYMAEGKHVPDVANELAKEESPKEKSKESQDQMFLVYNDKVINIQKDPQNADNSLVELDTVPYAKEHYDTSFLQGYLTATILQSLFGGGWSGSSHAGDYRGWSSTARVDQTPYESTAKKQAQPATKDSSGSFTSKGKAGNGTALNSTSTGSGSFTSGSSSNSVRKNDGSTPSNKSPSVSKPKTSTRSGSFSRKR